MPAGRRLGAIWKLVPCAAALSVVSAMLGATGAAAEAKRPADLWSPGPLPSQPSVSVSMVNPRSGPAQMPAALRVARAAEPEVHTAPHAVVWPATGAADVRLTRTGALSNSHREGPVPSRTLRLLTSGPVTAPMVPVNGRVKAAGTPIWVGPATGSTMKLPPTDAVRAARVADAKAGMPQAVHVAVASHSVAQRAGVNGLLFSLSRTDTGTQAERVAVGLAYSGIRDAFGGGFGERLHLVQYPACILTTPQKAVCRTATPVAASVNDAAHEQLVADVALPQATAPAQTMDAAMAGKGTGPLSGAVVLAATADAAGSSGSFQASPLSSSSKWGTSGATGAFTYSYPIVLPPSLGGAAPKVALSYNSQDADGRTSQTNNQGSWAGDSWTLWPGVVTRAYRTCADDGEAGTDQEECWAGDNATLMLNGASHELVPTSTAGMWRFADDDGSIVKELSGASNGLNGGMYWQVTDRAGDIYLFGAEHLPQGAPLGGTGSDASTNSAWGVPVFGNGSGEPCHGSTLDTSWCTQGWQWNLDFSVDSHHNITVYHYAAESNYYGRGSTRTPTSYTRGGALTSISYGQNISDYLTGHNPADKVTFTRAPEGRCDTTGGFTCSGATLSTSNASHWPDVPYDQNCGSSSCSNYAPSFWTNDRLTGISTQVWDTGLSTPGYRTVDSYTLANRDFPDPQDGTAGVDNSATPKAMWLDSITHTGADTGGGGTSVAEKPVTFAGAFLPNRVPGLAEPAVTQLSRKRMTAITTETGATIAVVYQNDTCSRTSPPAEDNDHTTCYPVRWTPRGYTAPILDWFNKYLIGEVDVSDNSTTNSPAHVTTYDYSVGTAAWHHDDDEITASKYRTWDQWRGYSQVTTRTGRSPDSIGKSITWYLQGMDGDLNADGTHKTAAVTPVRGGSIADVNALAGQGYQTTAYERSGGYARHRVITIPWISAATATHTRGDNLPDQVAHYTGTAASYEMSWLTGSTWRTAGTFTTYDGDGFPTNVDDRGEIDASDHPVSAGTTPEKCTTTAYAINSSGGPTGLASEVRTVSGDCSTPVDASHAISDVKTYYDGSTTLGAVVGPGDPTSVTALKDFDGTGGSVRWTTPTTTAYDLYGRITSTADAMGRTTSTNYLPNGSIALPTSVSTTNAKGWKSTSTLDVARGLTTSSTDMSGQVTSEVYDGLGRLLKVWSPAHPKASNASTPNVQFTYTVSNTGPSWVETQALRDNGTTYKPDYKIYDSLMQLREEQTDPTDGWAAARLISATFYDSHGRTVAADAAFFDDASAPTSTFVLPVDAQVPNETVTVYDGMGRVTSSSLKYDNVVQAMTTTAYPSTAETDVTPPAGGTPTATITDARGQTVELDQFHGATPSGTKDVTSYGYDAAGRQTSLTDSSGNTWATAYDQLGDKVKTTDPDTGTTTSTFDDDKEITETTDARHAPSGGITTSYDNLGRATDTYAVPAAGGTPVHLTHTAYDPAGALGEIAGTTAYDGSGRAWTNTITGYTADYLPTGSTTTIPAGSVNNSADVTYTTGVTYTPIARHVDTESLPAVGPMPAEAVGYGYQTNGLPVSVGGKDTYLAWMEYTHLGQPLRAHMGVTPDEIDETYNYEASTQRLLNATLDMQSGATHLDNTAYTYDPAGRITSISDAQDVGGVAKTDTQCFAYDYLGRLTQAWTDTGGTTTAPLPSIMGQGGCTDSTPSASNLGGPDAYWQSFTYDASGNRTGETDHSLTGDVGQDVTTTETYPAAGAAHPHAVSTSTTGRTGSGDQSFTYDASGNTTEIKQGAGNKVLASGVTLESGQSLVADSSRLTMQTDGNLALIALNSGQAIWSSDTAGNPGAVATMGTDGDLTVHTTSGTTLWASGTSTAGAFLRVQDAGQLVIFDTSWNSLWSTSGWTRSRAAADLQFAYDDMGRLASTTQPGTGGTATTAYHYDAAGNLLARTDVDSGVNTTTLFLGADQLTLDSAGSPTGDTRYYAISGVPTPVRTATSGSSTTSLHYQAADPHGTATTDITADNTSVTRRSYTPFGQDRTTGGNPTAWPGDKGYVDGTPDPTTGLTNLGAREYDPALGRFLAVDPVLDTTDPQSINGYAYADNTPVNATDPTGLQVEECATGALDGCYGGTPTDKSDYDQGRDNQGGSDDTTTGTCDPACQQALQALQNHDWKDDGNERKLHAALAEQLRQYVLALAGNTRPCMVGAEVSSGVMAACQQLGNSSPQLSWVDLLKLWAGGKGANVPFDAGSPITQQLATDKHNMGILKSLMQELDNGDFYDNINSLGGQDDYVDGKNLAQKMMNLPKDLTGMATSGRVGTGIPDAFTGGYDLVYQVINKAPKTRTFTVAFAAFNDTGTASLFHFGVPDVKRGFGGGSVYQTYYWTMEVSVG